MIDLRELHMGFIKEILNYIPPYIYIPVALIGAVGILRCVGDLEAKMEESGE